jgi:YjbE family integral membrane protein
VFNPELVASLLEILGVNIILSGDNAVVIALAARNLPPKQQRMAIILGSAAAILLRVVLTLVAAEMLKLPWLRLAGGALLLWIGVSLLLDGDGGDHGTKAGTGLAGAVRTILVADFVMSLDNVLGVAAAAKGHFGLLITGLVLSIPLIMFGSGIILRIMDRYPIIITLGAALIGYVAGEMLVDEPVLAHWLHDGGRWIHYAVAIACALLVVAVGTALGARAKRLRGSQVIDVDGSDAPDKEQ